MSDSAVLVEDHGPVRALTLNRPQRRNALDLDMRVALLEQVRAAEAEAQVRVLVLTGAGTTFCAGGDITGMTTDPTVGRQRLELMAQVATAIVESPLPVVVAVEGGAYGAGLGLVALGDLVITAEDASFVASFVKVGLTADTAATWTLTRRIGWSSTKRLLLTGAAVAAPQAQQMGLVDECVAAGTARARALEVAGDLARQAPLSLAATKGLMHSLPEELAAAGSAEVEAQLALFASEDFAAAQRAFAERSTPTFTGQ